MSSGPSKCLSRIYHAKGYVRPCSTQGPPAQPGRGAWTSRAPWWEAGAAAPPGADCLQGPASAPGDEGSLQGEVLASHLSFFTQQSHGLLLYRVLPPLLSIVFLV